MRRQRLGTLNSFTAIPSHLGEDLSSTLDSTPFSELGGDMLEGRSRDRCPSLETLPGTWPSVEREGGHGW